MRDSDPTYKETAVTTDVRAPAVAGTFYPGESARLADQVDRLLAAAPEWHGEPPKAIVVPHAGYVYSGPVAATAYRALRAARDRVRRVVLLGPAHRVAVRGLALPGVRAFATPLGEIPLDDALVRRVSTLPQVSVHTRCHAPEHSLEVQLPFLQRVLDDFTLLPLVVGDASPGDVADVLRAVWGGPETLIVISSDLSHYLTHDEATRVDRSTVELIQRGEPTLSHDQACGATPVNGLLRALREFPLDAEVVDLRNSGDTAGGHDRVVGYVSVLFTERRDGADEARFGRTLVQLARAAIDEALGGTPVWPATGARFDAPGAVFVTLLRDGSLRGCIGSLEACRPLREDLVANAVAAATRDPRFPPLTAAELPRVKIEVSLLSPPRPLAVHGEAEVLAAVRPGIDGVILEHGRHRATFLPQVWTQLPAPRDFFAHLKQKAGLAADFWAPTLRVSTYTVRKWSEA